MKRSAVCWGLVILASGSWLWFIWACCTAREPVPRDRQFLTAGTCRQESSDCDGRSLVIADANGLALFDISSRTIRCRLAQLREWPRWIRYSVDGRKLLTLQVDETVALWDTATGKRLTHFKTDAGGPYYMCCSPSGDRVALVNTKGDTKLWDVSSGKRLPIALAKNAPYDPVFFAPDGQALTVDQGPRGKRFRDIVNGSERCVLAGYWLFVDERCFSEDGSIIVGTAARGSLALWDSHTGHKLRSYRVPAEWSVEASLSKDGNKIIVEYFAFAPTFYKLAPWIGGNRAGKLFPPYSGVAVLDRETGKTLAHLRDCRGPILLEDGKTLLVYGFDSAIQLWDVPPKEIFLFARCCVALLPAVFFTGSWWYVRPLLQKKPQQQVRKEYLDNG